MKNKEIEELLKGMKNVSNTEGCYMNLDRDLVKLLLSYIEQLEKENKKANKYIDFYKDLTEKQNKSLEEFKQEHLIMKQILIENGLWEKLLNDDRFLNYLREGDSDNE